MQLGTTLTAPEEPGQQSDDREEHHREERELRLGRQRRGRWRGAGLGDDLEAAEDHARVAVAAPGPEPPSVDAAAAADGEPVGADETAASEPAAIGEDTLDAAEAAPGDVEGAPSTDAVGAEEEAEEGGPAQNAAPEEIAVIESARNGASTVAGSSDEEAGSGPREMAAVAE